MRLGINVFDLQRIDARVRGPLIAGKLALSGAVNIDPSSEDDRAVVFTCDLLLAAATCDQIRSNDRAAGQAPTRVYLDRGEGWEKLPAQAVLAEMRGGKLALSYSILPPEVVPATPLQPEAL